MRPRCRRGQGGASLIEALIAFLVLSVGLVAIARLQTRVQHSAEAAAQRSHALRLAQREMEHARAPHLGELMSTEDERGTRYWLERRTAAADPGHLQSITVAVHWIDRDGEAQAVVLRSLLGDAPPALSGALALPRPTPAVIAVHGRSPWIPLGAHDRGDGSSVLEPRSGRPLAFVFDNTSGRIVAVCTDTTAARPPGGCTAVDALLLEGWVRFALTAPPDPEHGDDAPLPLTIALQPTQGTLVAPGCIVDAQQRALAYHCAIAPEGGVWSGRSVVVPQGWPIGSAATQYKVCRYSVPPGGDGRADRNAAHPDVYDRVDRNLMQQNFLVIRGDQACPVATAAHQP